nr:hypothetical protein [Planktotalea sp.]
MKLIAVAFKSQTLIKSGSSLAGIEPKMAHVSAPCFLLKRADKGATKPAFLV